MTTAAARVRDSVCDPGPETGWDQDYQLTAPYFAPALALLLAIPQPITVTLSLQRSCKLLYTSESGADTGGGGGGGVLVVRTPTFHRL